MEIIYILMFDYKYNAHSISITRRRLQDRKSAYYVSKLNEMSYTDTLLLVNLG